VQVPAGSQASEPLQTVESAQDVPAAAAAWTTPTAASHESVVQRLPSSTTGGAPGVQWPVVSQASRPLQASPSSQKVATATGRWVAPAMGSQTSAVQGLPSSSVGEAPARQAPEAEQDSVPLQALPSAQEVPTGTGVCAGPVPGLQVSVVHGLSSSTVGGVPLTQAPALLHVSGPSQTLPSEQGVPGLARVCVGPPGAPQLASPCQNDDGDP
jgi:hypothetical protein